MKQLKKQINIHKEVPKKRRWGLLIAIAVFVLLDILIYCGIRSSFNNDTKMNNTIVLIETNYGEFKLELFDSQMPITTGNFKKLVKQGFYDGTKFHRVIENFMIQGGDPLSKNDSIMNRWGTGGSEPIQDEFVKGLSNVEGTIAMANTGKPNSGSSQFFINVANNTGLDFDKVPYTSRHPVFGRVISGMDVVLKISAVETSGRPYDRPIEPVILEKASILE